MPVLSSLHELFHAQACDLYIHTLRWKDRPLQCPRCHSHKIGPWGAYHYRQGLKRYRCKGCRRTFNDLTQTLLSQSKQSLAHWILATFLLCLTCSSRRIAREVGIHLIHTAANFASFFAFRGLSINESTFWRMVWK
jgi:transposase-like protein